MQIEKVNNKLCAVEMKNASPGSNRKGINDLVRATLTNKLNSLLILYPK